MPATGHVPTESFIIYNLEDTSKLPQRSHYNLEKNDQRAWESHTPQIRGTEQRRDSERRREVFSIGNGTEKRRGKSVERRVFGTEQVNSERRGSVKSSPSPSSLKSGSVKSSPSPSSLKSGSVSSGSERMGSMKRVKFPQYPTISHPQISRYGEDFSLLLNLGNLRVNIHEVISLKSVLTISTVRR